jgi:hypothetical protein
MADLTWRLRPALQQLLLEERADADRAVAEVEAALDRAVIDPRRGACWCPFPCSLAPAGCERSA